MTKPNGLDASGHLLLAKAHLVKAEEKLRQRPSMPENEDAMYTRLTIKHMAEIAVAAVRAGMKMLKEE